MLLVTVPTKQEGEECGMCLNPDTDYFCGSCAHGLECLKSFGSTFIPDAPSRCTKKPGNCMIWMILFLTDFLFKNKMSSLIKR